MNKHPIPNSPAEERGPEPVVRQTGPRADQREAVPRKESSATHRDETHAYVRSYN